MPLSEEQVDAALASRESNAPKNLSKGVGHAAGAPRTYVSPEQARKRRETVGRMLMNGSSTDFIIEAMGRPKLDDGSPGYGMTEDQIKILIREVRAHWEAEDEERDPYDKSAAVRRHLSHIRKAEQRGQFQAVAALEKNLAAIQGTNEPLEVMHNHGSVRMGDAVMKVLGNLAPEKLRALIEEEKRLEAYRKPIDVQGEAVEGEKVLTG